MFPMPDMARTTVRTNASGNAVLRHRQNRGNKNQRNGPSVNPFLISGRILDRHRDWPRCQWSRIRKSLF
ncbi:MAG: hypothetical protein CMJ77_00430 [Planctomycetaceae bacterium]|nr:hypothetical protein [Planctomycetaceae bacterium]